MQFVKVPDAGVPKTGAVNVLLANVSVPFKVAIVPVVGNVILVVPVEVKVIGLAPEVIKLELLASVRTPPVVAVIVKPLILVADATPKTGVVSVLFVNV